MTITTILAIWGAGLSTFKVLWDFFRERRRLTIKLGTGLAPLRSPRDLDEVLTITVANPGKRPVTVNTPFFTLPDKSTMFFPVPRSNVDFPHALGEGTSCVVVVDLGQIRQELWVRDMKGRIKISAGCRDALEKKYTSNTIALDIKPS